MGPYRMSQAPAAARLVAPTGGTLGVISGLLRTAAGTIDLTAVAAAANKHLRSTTDTHEQPGRHLHRRGLAHAWTTITMLGIMPRHACSARCGARRRSGTWRFRSASCLPIRQVVNAQLCARSTSSHLRRTPTCGYVDNASALPTDPQDQKTKVSVNLIALEAQHSNPVRHNPDRQPRQPRHPSPHSVSILATIYSHLRQRWQDLFGAKFDILLYDLTSTYFECDPPDSDEDKRRFGYNRDKRNDCVQVVIGLVVTPDGFPLGYEVLAGNTRDSATLRPFLRKIEEQYGKAERIWVMDRGIPTEEVLAEMRQANPPIYYLVGTPKGRLTKLEKALLKLPWQAVREGVDVKLLPKEAELYVLAKSDARILKERGIRRRKLRWLLARLKEISKMELQRDDLLMKLGAAKAKAPAAWRLVDVEVAPEGATFSYALNRKKLRKVWRREGRYLLRTNLSGRDPAELWQFYIQLVEVEAAFKNLKDDLQLRPIYHQLIGRIEAHIFVAFLAYCLHVTLRARLRPLASGLTPRAVLDKFAAIQMLDVHFPTTDGRTLILSRYTELNADQKLLVKQLNLDLPVQPRPRITAGGQIVQAAAPAL
jgi:transposase